MIQCPFPQVIVWPPADFYSGCMATINRTGCYCRNELSLFFIFYSKLRINVDITVAMKCQREYPKHLYLQFKETRCFIQQFIKWFIMCDGRCWSWYSGSGWDHDCIQWSPIRTCELHVSNNWNLHVSTRDCSNHSLLIFYFWVSLCFLCVCLGYFWADSTTETVAKVIIH